jgi:hypothetical protein
MQAGLFGQFNPSHPMQMRFSGYEPRPLQAIYTQPIELGDLYVTKELKEISKREADVTQAQIGQPTTFNVLMHMGRPGLFSFFSGKWDGKLYQNPFDVPLVSSPGGGVMIEKNNLSRWAQDCKTLVKDPDGVVRMLILPTLRCDISPLKTPQGKLQLRNEQQSAQHLADLLGIPTRKIKSYIEWGNAYLGHKTNKEPYIIIGKDTLRINALELAGKFSKYQKDTTHYETLAQAQIAADLHLDPKNVIVIKQPAGHIDLAIRPLNSPVVLVNSFDMTLKQLTEERDQLSTTDPDRAKLDQMIEDTQAYQQASREEGNFATPEETAQELKAHGFEPVFVPGAMGTTTNRKQGHFVNYMNALVHKRPNGQLVYMTNGSGFDRLNQIFQRALTKQAKDVASVDFIKGQIDDKTGLSHMEKSLSDMSGGLHCMSTEHPNFDIAA